MGGLGVSRELGWPLADGQGEGTLMHPAQLSAESDFILGGPSGALWGPSPAVCGLLSQGSVVVMVSGQLLGCVPEPPTL